MASAYIFSNPIPQPTFILNLVFPFFLLLSLLHVLLILADSPLAKAQADSVFYQSIQSLTFQIKKETNLPSQLKIKQITFKKLKEKDRLIHKNYNLASFTFAFFEKISVILSNWRQVCLFMATFPYQPTPVVIYNSPFNIIQYIWMDIHSEESELL